MERKNRITAGIIAEGRNKRLRTRREKQNNTVTSSASSRAPTFCQFVQQQESRIFKPSQHWQYELKFTSHLKQLGEPKKYGFLFSIN